MMYELKQALHLGGKDYPRGVHDLDKNAEEDSNFLKYVGAGFVAEAPVAKVIASEDFLARQKKLQDRLLKQMAPKVAEEAAAQEEAKEEKKHGKKSKKHEG